MKTKIIIASVALLLIVGTTMKLKSNKRIVESNLYHPDTTQRILVHAGTAELKNLEGTFTYTGAFAPNREVNLIPQAHGQVTGIFFEEGDYVKAGKLLVQVDNDLLMAQEAAAEASYQTAQRTLQRNESAAASGGVSGAQLDNLRLNAEQALSQLKQLRKQIAMCRLEAPFSGTITFRDVEPGSLAGNGPVARVTDLSQLKLEISVPEKEIGMFREGDYASVTNDLYPDKAFRGRISYVAERAGSAHSYLVRIVVPNTDNRLVIRAGMYGTVTINKNLTTSLLIPRIALLGSAKNPQVFIIRDSAVALVNIRTGRSNLSSIEVEQGLRAGDLVVTSGHINLAAGSKVAIVR